MSGEAPCLYPEGRPDEDIARWGPSESQGEGAQENPNLLTLQYWSFSPQNSEKIHFCCRYFVWQTNTICICTNGKLSHCRRRSICVCHSHSLETCHRKESKNFTCIISFHPQISKTELSDISISILHRENWVTKGFNKLTKVTELAPNQSPTS